MNRGFHYSETIGPPAEGKSLLAHLTERYSHTPETQWRERIEGGLVTVDGRGARPGDILRRGQVVVWSRPPWKEPEVQFVYAVLYEDDDLLAVCKPCGLPTLPGAGFLEHTLLALVRARVPGASPCHRLGRGTTGLVLFTKNREAGRAVAKAWREHRVTKVYRALVVGCPALDTFEVDAPIGPIPHPTLGLLHTSSPAGKAARSLVRVLERREGVSLVEVHIETGRPHQIRIHMAACGHPLAGDPLYAPGGRFREDTGALPGDTGYLLHSLRLALRHPRTGEPFQVESPPPPALRRHSLDDPREAGHDGPIAGGSPRRR